MKKITVFLLAFLMIFTNCAPVTIKAEDIVAPEISGFDLTESDVSMWNIGGWGNEKLENGTLTITNGWGYYAGARSSQDITFTFNLAEEGAGFEFYFRKNITEEEMKSGSISSKSGDPFVFNYSGTSGSIFFTEYTNSTSTQLRNSANTVNSGGTKQGLNDGENHTVTIQTVETDITELRLFIDGVYMFSSYYHGGVKNGGYLGFTNYRQKGVNITEIYMNGVNIAPELIGKETAYSTFGFESELVAKYPNGASDTVYAETISAAAHSGEKGLHLVKEAGSSCWFYVALSDVDTEPLISGKTYRASMYIKTNPETTASGQTTFNFYSAANSGNTSLGSLNCAKQISNWGISNGYADYLDTAKDKSNDGWTKLLINTQFTAKDGYPYVVLVIWAETDTAFDWYIDDIEFCEITQVVADMDGVTGGSFEYNKADNIYSLGSAGNINVTDGDFAYGDTVELKAVPDEGYCLESWYINGEKIPNCAEKCNFELTANTKITARFVEGCNLLHTIPEGFELRGGATLSDFLILKSNQSAILKSLLFDDHEISFDISVDFNNGNGVISVLNQDFDELYTAKIFESAIVLYENEKVICESECFSLKDLSFQLLNENNSTRIIIKNNSGTLIDYSVNNKEISGYHLGISSQDGATVTVGHIRTEGLTKSDVINLYDCYNNIEKTTEIDFGSDFMALINSQYDSLSNEFKVMLPNTEKLQHANEVYNQFVEYNKNLDGLISYWDYSLISQENGGRLKFNFKTDSEINDSVIENGFSHIANGAVILPEYLVAENGLYVSCEKSEIVEFENDGRDISHFSLSLTGWKSRTRRNTELCARGYSVYCKDGIKIRVYSDLYTTSVYESAVRQYYLITLKDMDVSVFNGENALLYLSGDTENQAIDISLPDIKANVKTIGRTTYTDTALLIDRAMAGFAISGEFKGDVIVNFDVALNEGSSVILYSVIDGDYSNANRILAKESGSYVIASFHENAEHTIEVFKATEGGHAKLDVKSLQMTGTLYEAPPEKDLLIEFLGDSITSGWGVYTYEQVGNGNSDVSLISDSFLTYASLTARNLSADISVISRSGIKTQELFETQYPYIHDRSKEIWGHYPHPDIIVVNLGQNDVKNLDGYTELVEEKILKLREIHPDAAIVWVNGMMSTTVMPFVEQAVNNIDDELVFSCCLPTNTDGEGSHPSVSGQAKAAETLTEFLQQTVVPKLN